MLAEIPARDILEKRIHTTTLRRILKVLKKPEQDFYYSIHMDSKGSNVCFQQNVCSIDGRAFHLGYDDLLFDLAMQLWEHFLYEEGFEFSRAQYYFHKGTDGEWAYNFKIEPTES